MQKTTRFEPRPAHETILTVSCRFHQEVIRVAAKRANLSAPLSSYRCHAHRVTQADHPRSHDTESSHGKPTHAVANTQCNPEPTALSAHNNYLAKPCGRASLHSRRK